MKSIGLILLSLMIAPATWACESEVGNLNLVFPNESSLRNPVKVRFSLEKDVLHARFEIHTPYIYAFEKEKLGPTEFPYQRDVVEVFLAVSKNEEGLPYPYFEFELSPLNHDYSVKILAPKKPFLGGVDLGLIHSVEKIPGGWRGNLTIPLDKLGWDGNPKSIVGNAYAILGKPPRSFFGLTLPQQTKPNFHKPEFFKPLLPCDTPTEE